MVIQWYPGHMTKAKRQIEEDMKKIDLCIELRDSRAVLSSGNPDIDRLAKNKYRIVLLNKADLANDRISAEWVDYFKARGIQALLLDARSAVRMKEIQSLIKSVCGEKFERDRKRGILNRPVRAIVAGIPNVGKSTFINSLAKKGAAKTGNKPGVTKGTQWINLNKDVELLDTPGILWPKFNDENVGRNLALIGSINDDIIDKNGLAYEFVKYLMKTCPEAITGRYNVNIDSEDANDIIASVAIEKSCLIKGGLPDVSRASSMIIEDFRSGKLGKISLERP